jgi:hypothetical protein
MDMRKCMAIVIAAMWLNACGTTSNTYVEPARSAESTAVLKGKSDWRSLAKWTYFVVETIDGRSIAFMKSGAAYDYSVAAGLHKVMVKGSFNTGWGGSCPCESRLVLNAEFVPGQSYRINGEVRDNRMVAWIENATTSERVSEIAEEPYVTSPKDTGYVVIL